jgi:lysophospholipid acyltransferase (LPLAT)-like uncharacterized protein
MALIRLLDAWMSTLHGRVAMYDATADPTQASFAGPNIYLFWHEYIPLPLTMRPHCNLAMLASPHQDAELLTHAGHFAGLETIRGSTHRGATAALKTLLQRGRGMSLAITPDGPRGPRRVLAPGCIYLSSRLQVPIVPLGCGYDRPWRIRRVWDQFAVPRPYSRARGIMGPRLQIPPGIEKAEIEPYRQWIEDILNGLTAAAERWAEGAVEYEPQFPLYPAPAHPAARS